MRKKVIILWHNGGRLANQLWLFVSVYAYGLEQGYKIENHSFFEYSSFFKMRSGNRLIDFLFFHPYNFLKKILPKNFYADSHDYFFRRYYKVYVKLVHALVPKKIIYAEHEQTVKIHYLKPTGNTDLRLDEFEKSAARKIYFQGWLFRNPIGLEKYRPEITEYFQPPAKIILPVTALVAAARKKYATIVGVHIRQGDYQHNFANGKLFFNADEVKAVLNQYLEFFQKDKKSVGFIICSDGPVDQNKFSGLNIITTNFKAIQDLYLLAQTDIIIGSDSTFGFFASYYGNIPLIVLKKEKIDWQYYLNKKSYFNNKYSLCFDTQYEQ